MSHHPKVTSHNVDDRAGCISLHRAHQTGVLVGIYLCEEAGLDGGEGNPYVTVCELHGSICGHVDRAAAIHHGPSPADWCEPCQAILDGKPIKSTRAQVVKAIRRSLRRLENLDRDLAAARLGYPAGKATTEIAEAGVNQARTALKQLEEELEVEDGIYLTDNPRPEGDLTP